jgi:hypothetical protein
LEAHSKKLVLKLLSDSAAFVFKHYLLIQVLLPYMPAFPEWSLVAYSVLEFAPKVVDAILNFLREERQRREIDQKEQTDIAQNIKQRREEEAKEREK